MAYYPQFCLYYLIINLGATHSVCATRSGSYYHSPSLASIMQRGVMGCLWPRAQGMLQLLVGLSCCQRVFWHLCCPLSWSHTYLSARTSQLHYGRLSSRNLSLLQAKTAYQCCAQTGTESCCYSGTYNGEEQMRTFSAGSTNVDCPIGFRLAINLLIVAQKGAL